MSRSFFFYTYANFVERVFFRQYLKLHTAAAVKVSIIIVGTLLRTAVKHLPFLFKRSIVE